MYTHSRLVAEREVAFTLFTLVGYTWSTGLASPEKRWWTFSISIQRFPVLIGESLKDFKTYQRAVQATWLSLSEEDQKRLGPKLFRNLLRAKTSVSIFIEQLDPALLTGTDGPAKLLAELENGRFQKTGFQEMPRAYETFCEKTEFQRGGLEPMAMYLTAIEVAKRDLEAVDTKTKISQNELGYHALKNSGLSREEQRMGVVPRRGDLRLCADQSDVEEPFFPVEHTLEGRRDNIKRDINNAEHHHDFVKDHAGHTWLKKKMITMMKSKHTRTRCGCRTTRVTGMNGQMNNILTCATTIPRRHDDSDAFLLEDAVDEWMAV